MPPGALVSFDFTNLLSADGSFVEGQAVQLEDGSTAFIQNVSGKGELYDTLDCQFLSSPPRWRETKGSLWRLSVRPSVTLTKT